MTSKREKIVQAIATKLGSVVGVDGRVYRSQADPNPRDLQPYLAVQWTNEQVAPDVVNLLGRVLTVEVSVYTRGDTPDSLADDILVSAHALITSDPSLGGLALDTQLEDASVEIVAADFPAAKVTHSYSVKFRHSYGDMTA
jgi:hypothetical protein